MKHQRRQLSVDILPAALLSSAHLASILCLRVRQFALGRYSHRNLTIEDRKNIMVNPWRRRSLLIICLLFVFCSLTAITSARHSWRKFHWARQSNPFTIKLGSNLSSGWTSSLNLASADWSLSSVLNTSVVAGGTNSNCNPTLGRVEVCNGAYGNNGWLGIASVWTSGSHITQATT